MRMHLAAVVALALVPTLAAAQASPTSAKPPKNDVTLVGCLEHESTYRQSADLQKGGPLESGIGQDDEFVLADARPLSPEGAAVGTSGGVRRGRAFMLGGKIEKNLQDAIGRQVEVVGELDDAAKTGPGKLPKVNITVWHEVGDYCPAK